MASAETPDCDCDVSSSQCRGPAGAGSPVISSSSPAVGLETQAVLTGAPELGLPPAGASAMPSFATDGSASLEKRSVTCDPSSTQDSISSSSAVQGLSPRVSTTPALSSPPRCCDGDHAPLERVEQGPVGLGARAGIALVRAYQKLISPLLPPACRFYPTCSQYAAQSMRKYGLLRGAWRAIKRLGRCHPFHPGGYDPVR